MRWALCHFVALLFLTGASAWAGGDTIPGSRYTSGRAVALGGAYLALADDGAGGLFYNPAAIGKIKGPGAELVNLQLQLNAHYVNTFDLNFFKITSLSSDASVLGQNLRAFPGVSGALVPTVFFRGFTLGLLAESRFAGTSDGTNIHYRSNYQLVPTFGTALRLASGVVRIGYSLQWVNRATGDLTVAATATPLGWNQGLAQGSAISHNVGFAVTLPYTNLPSLNAVVRNLGTAHYSSFTLAPMAANSSGLPADEPMSVDFGLGLTPKLGSGATFSWVLDWRDATNTSHMPLLGHISTGAEYGFRNQFFLRGGIGSGYPTAGVGLRTRKADFHLTWFSEETGTSFRSERDVRFVLHYQVRAF